MRKFPKRNFIGLICLMFLLFSCQKRKAEKQAAIDDDILKTFIADHQLNAIKTESGLYIVVENSGSGASCNSYSTVKASYKGYFTNGSVFDSSYSSGIVFDLQSVIPGWTEGIPHFKEGGNGKLLIPSALAYGSQGTSGIPKNSVLIFDVALIQVL